MILRRFYNEKLAQASYLVGCAKSGEALVLDANRAIEEYIHAAEDERLRITAVTETHIHADYVSGSRELAERTGAQLYLSSEGDEDWKYAFADQPNVTLVKDGDEIRIGNVSLKVRKTPGHTPEHISFILTDHAATEMPLGAFTGDFIFVGDVGRPDLLERAAGFQGTMEKGAQVLFESLQTFKSENPDTLLIWPGHGAGSACGKALGGVPVSTLGYEKTANWGLKANSEAAFIQGVLEGQPEPPTYFKHMKQINKMGPPLLNGFRVPPRLASNAILDLIDKSAAVLDVRDQDTVASGYIRGSIHIAAGKSFIKWAGWLLPYDKPIYLMATDEGQAMEVARDMAMIGLDDVAGWFGEDALAAWETRRGRLDVFDQLSSREAYQRTESGSAAILDVRGLGEWIEGHVPGSKHIPLGYLQDRVDELQKDKQYLVLCYSGSRSAIAMTILKKHGFKNVAMVSEGFSEYEQTGLPIETGERVAMRA